MRYPALKLHLKGHYVVLEKKLYTQNINIYNIDEVILQTLERWQGPPHTNKVKQCGIVEEGILKSVCSLRKKGIFASHEDE